jgi:hypothetical protein
MKIIMTSVYDDGKKIQLNPGDIADIDDAEAQRIISVGGGHAPTDAEIAADLEAKEAADRVAIDAAPAKEAAARIAAARAAADRVAADVAKEAADRVIADAAAAKPGKKSPL